MKTHIPIRIVLILLLSALTAAATAPALSAPARPNPPLGIFGNANGDDVIDMRDVTLTERIILGLLPATPLADARHDGKLDVQDISQTELIIGRQQTKITFEDEQKKAVTFDQPIRRVIPEHITSLAAMRIIHGEDLMISAGSTAVKECMGPAFLLDLFDLPTIGAYGQPDYEAILHLNPDVLIAYRCGTLQEKLPGVTVFYAGYGEPYPPGNLPCDMRKLGILFDRRDEAERYIDWHNTYLNMITERISTLSKGEKPRVYTFYPLLGFYMCRGTYPPVELAGGISIGRDLGPEFAVAVDPEWVIRQNPDVIIGATIPDRGAYDTGDASQLTAQRNDIMARPELAHVTAVAQNRVYFQNNYALGLFPNFILSIAYYAKWLHPHLFEDLDPQAVHQEYLDKFQRINFRVDRHGVFVCPPPRTGHVSALPGKNE
ncbi:ABC transporter substrate-binding protein [Desulfospira joergensenii]|uniref:ABC transporter substrate-binding protein n=1 Tax=Desulfospira joergensenii TaxID=53329 RepID=UPI0003B3CB17|nr:ABC transporter substrate-binding protein [Desulfospira joergensenii]